MTAGVCGKWSAKDVLAHITSFEAWHVEVLGSFLLVEPQPLMAAWAAGEFNDQQVDLRRALPVHTILDEYNEAHQELMERAARIPSAEYTRVGRIPWYGVEYSLDDFLVYSNYGHKREHSAQINTFTDRFILDEQSA
jgi:hypothetical protein